MERSKLRKLNLLVISTDYIADRLTSFEDLKPLSAWLKATFEPLKNIPRYLIPCYFDAIVSGVYNVLINQVNELMPE